MSLNKKKKNKEELDGQDEYSFLNEKLQSMSKENLNELLQFLILINPKIRMSIIEWMKHNLKSLNETDSEKTSTFLNDNLLMDYWENTQEIIAEFNAFYPFYKNF